MSLRLICGRSGSGKSEFCFNEATEKLKDNRIYIITPEQFSYSAEKKLMDKQESGAIINGEVLTFKRMAYRVQSEVGGTIDASLSKTAKAMLVYSILLDSKNHLTFLGKTEQNVDIAQRALTEFKKHNVSLENLKEAINNTDDRYLQEKLKDLYYIYEKFENRISNKYIDDNDLLTILVEQLEHTNMFKDSLIYIDEFTGYTNQEYRIIEQLLKQAKEVTITVTTDDLDLGRDIDTDVFYSNKQTADKLLFLARNNKIECEKTIFLNELKRFKNDELIHLEKNIYQIPYTVYGKDVQNINLFLASNAYNEVENVAKEITRLVKREGYRYKDISVIAKDLEVYSNLTKAIFDSYDIPVFIDEKKNLSQNMFIKYIISLLDIYSKSWSFESVINYIKTNFVDLDKDDVYYFETYCRKWGIKGSKWYNGEWNFEEETDDNKEQLEKIRIIKEKVINPLYKFKTEFQENKNVETIAKGLYNFLIENQIDKALLDKKQWLEDNDYIELASEQEHAWKIVMNLLDELIEVFGQEKITFEKFINLFKIGLNTSSLTLIPQTQDQVLVGDIDRSRTHKVRTVFILGMNDGVFPGSHKEEGFLGDNDRKALKEKGIELAKGTMEMLYEDNLSIYKAFTIAEEKLFLSYCSSDLDGGSLRPSILINKIKKIYPNIVEESDLIEKEEDLLMSNQVFDNLIQNLNKFKIGEEINPKWFVIYNYFNDNEEWSKKLQNAIEAISYTNQPDKLSKENVDKLYGKTLNTTVSRLETYQSCPFSYYLKYGLKVNSQDQFEVRPLDTGNFMHDVIDTFFKTIREKELDVKEIEEKQIKEILDEIIDEKLQLSQNYILTSTDKYRTLTRRLKNVIHKSMKYIIEGLRQSDFSIFGTEVEFRKGKSYEPIELELESGKKVEITGKIDRIDLAKNSDGKYIRIIDYKSSVKNIELNQVVAGLQIQLLTYLDAACKIEEMMPAGVLYFSLIDPIISAKRHMTDEEIEVELKKKFKMNGLILADVNVVKMMDKTLESGQSSVVPAYIDSSGNLSKKSNAINKRQFEDLQKHTTKIIKEISKEILSGNIDIKPYYNLKNNKTPCQYCDYKMICQFKAGTNNNNYKYISKKSKEEILDEIKSS